MSKAHDIIKAALDARTLDDARVVQRLIEKHVGACHERPLGDRWNNLGLITASGSFDHKVLEPVTNMQDAVLERLAASKFGDLSKVPYCTPREAAADLFAGRDYKDLAGDVTVTFHEAEPPASATKKITVAFRDHGCGIDATAVGTTIFALGSSHKTKSDWQQGAFGLGGASTFRNAEAVVLVTRRAAEMPGTSDRIVVAVVMWQSHGKARSAYYLTTSSWIDPGDVAEPWSAPASEFPKFEAGTYLALISYGVEGYHRARLGDERSFDTVLDTRLFQPIMPVRFTNAILRSRNEHLRGLERRLTDNPRKDRREGHDTLPFHVGGVTYQLPVRFYVFSPPGEAGERRKFVAKDHAMVFTSNGQAHHHWSPAEFRVKTRLNKLYDRILVVVETDALPIEVRTDFFTPDRSHLLSSDDALRLENTVAAFLDAWNELGDINGELIREAITRSTSTESAVEVARQISRALKVPGFALSGSGTTGGGGGGGRQGGPRKPIDLYPDPTFLEGPEKVVVPDDSTRFVQYTLNAVDGFMPARGRLEVTCDHPDINAPEITVGQLHQGGIRVSIVVPPKATEGTYTLSATLDSWTRVAGGIGKTLTWVSEFEVVDDLPGRRGAAVKGGKTGSGDGPLVAVIWSTPDQQGSDWHNGIPGHVEDVPAKTLAERPEYAGLASLGDKEVPTIVLNSEYRPFKTYIAARSRELTSGGVEGAKQRYAVGTGLGLLYLRQQIDGRRKKGEKIDESLEVDAKQAVARTAVTMMPAFDKLASETGVEV